MRFISTRWALLGIRVLGNYTDVRFGQANKTILGLIARGLSASLSQLQEDGLAGRHVYPDASLPDLSYHLTEKGAAPRRARIPRVKWPRMNDGTRLHRVSVSCLAQGEARDAMRGV